MEVHEVQVNVHASDKEKKWQKKLELLEEKVKFYQQHHWVPEYKPRLTEPMPYWKVFYRQREAIERAMLDKEDVHVFAYEPAAPGECSGSPGTGKRKYVVTSHPELWNLIQNAFEHRRPATFYEVIPAGAACKLYFDLEYQKQHNPMHDGKQMVVDLIEVVCQRLQGSFGISCSSRNVVVLDASTESKFSSHLIFNLPKRAVFKDNIHVGHFVHQLCDDLRQEHQKEGRKEEVPSPGKRSKVDLRPDPLEGSFFVKNAEDKVTLFIDEGVYTKNRNFRLYKCTKLGKNNPLVEADYDKYEVRFPRGKKTSRDKKLFYDSLISIVSCNSDARILTLEPRERVKSPSPLASPCCRSSTTVEGYDASESPFPELDAFVRGAVTKGGVQGILRQWVYFAESGTMLYEIHNNRWCENIGRAHKGNNIMIIVHLKRRIFYQKCHDPDCKRAAYKSPERPLPSDCLPVTEDYDDDELLLALEVVERGTVEDAADSRTTGADSSWISSETTTESGNEEISHLEDSWITDDEFCQVYDRLQG